MKRIFTVVLCLLLVIGVFAGCSDSGSASAETDTTQKDTSTTASQLATDSAKITGSQAITLLKSYSKEELGLDKVDKDYQFMLSTVGVELKGKKYVRAEAGSMEENGKDEDGNPTYQMKSYKTFYISYDGKKLLVAQDDGDYKTIKIDKEHLEKITTKADSTTKK